MYPSKIRLSYSTLELLNLCERKLQMVKLLKGYDEREENEHFSFGNAWGAGVVEYLLTGSMDAALYKAWLAYWPNLETEKKNQVVLFNALRVAQKDMDTYRMKFEIATFHGKPAIELSFRIDINELFYYVGYIDAVFKHRVQNYYAVLENKHNGAWINDIDPMYRNSGQGLGYSIVLDKIAEQDQSAYAINYFVAQLKGNPYEPIIHQLEYKKTLLDRLKWFYTLGIDVDRLTKMMKLNLFPMRGGSCIQFNRPCQFFGICGLQVNDKPKTDEDVKDNKEYQFIYTLDEIVADHLKRIKERTLI